MNDEDREITLSYLYLFARLAWPKISRETKIIQTGPGARSFVIPIQPIFKVSDFSHLDSRSDFQKEKIYLDEVCGNHRLGYSEKLDTLIISDFIPPDPTPEN